jgi:hypothetical protein
MDLFGGEFHDFAVVTDDEESTDGFTFATFAADFAGEVDDDAEVFEGDFGFESLEVAGGESGELFGEVDDGEGIAGIFFEGGVDDDGDIAGLEEFVGDGFEENLGDLELSGLGFVLDGDDVDVVAFGGIEDVFLVGGDDDAEGGFGWFEFGEVEWPFGDDNERGGLDVLGEACGSQEEFMEVFLGIWPSHARSVCRGRGRSTDQRPGKPAVLWLELGGGGVLIWGGGLETGVVCGDGCGDPADAVVLVGGFGVGGSIGAEGVGESFV